MITEKCSLFKPYYHREHGWCMSKKPETVDIIDMLFSLKQIDLLNQIRSETDINNKKILKKQLWAITPSSIQEGGRGVDYVIQHTGLMAFDIDKYQNNPITIDQYSMIFEYIKNIPFTIYCGRSAGGLGIWGLFRISNPEKHSQHFEAMQMAFKNAGIDIDPAPKSVASLRFVSYDNDAYINHEALPFTNILEPKVKERITPFESKGNTKSENGLDTKLLIQKFNATCTPEDMHSILENFGFQYHSTTSNKVRFTRPGKETKAGLSIDYHTDKRTLYSFSSETPLLEFWKPENGGWSCSPVTALLLYGFGGMDKKHWAQAFNYLKTK